MGDFLSQFQCLFDHDSNSIKNLMNGSFAHECRGSDQFIFDINVCFLHFRVDVFAAHLLHGACGLSVGPPNGEKRRKVKTVLLYYVHELCENGFTHMSHSLSAPTVSSQPGRTLAARTEAMQHIPSGFPALWKALMIFSNWGWMVNALFFTAQSLRFFATPKPPKIWAHRIH